MSRGLPWIVALLLGVAALSPGVVAQTEKRSVRIGVLAGGLNPPSAPFYVAYEARLRELGWVAGRNLVIEWRLAEGRGERAAEIAREFVRLKVDAILASGPELAVRATREATRTIPIVMVALNYDPLAAGYVASLAQPGGNVTGIFFRQPEQEMKRLELLKELFPRARQFAMWSDEYVADQVKAVQKAALALGVRIHVVELRAPYDLEAAILAVKRSGAAGLLVPGSPLSTRERARIGALALKHRVPTIGGGAQASPGLLVGYGVNLSNTFRRAAELTDKVLRGTRPAEIPVEQPTTFELIVNLKVAGTLGVPIPQSLLSRADRIIE